MKDTIQGLLISYFTALFVILMFDHHNLLIKSFDVQVFLVKFNILEFVVLVLTILIGVLYKRTEDEKKTNKD